MRHVSPHVLQPWMDPVIMVVVVVRASQSSKVPSADGGARSLPREPSLSASQHLCLRRER